MERCEAVSRKDGFGALMAAFQDERMLVRCRLASGHEGKHHANYCPFPGFVDEHVYWTDAPSQGGEK